MRIAVLVKQIPAFEELELGPDGRLVRAGIELELNPYCRRAVALAAVLAAERPGSEVVALTLGPPSAEDALREAIAWCSERGVDARGVLVTDPALAGSDTLATAKALAAALGVLGRTGPFDLVLTGRNSVDADTAQVGPQLASLLDLPFLTAVREVVLTGGELHARCEHDDGFLDADVELPAVLSCAERLVDPAKVDPAGRAAVPADRLSTLTAADLGAGPWGVAASPTRVGPVKVVAVTRARERHADLPLGVQVERAVRRLHERGALAAGHDFVAEHHRATVEPHRPDGARIVVLCEPGRDHANRELIGAAGALTGSVRAVVLDPPAPGLLGSWGADDVVHLTGTNVEEDVAAAVALVVDEEPPWAVLAPSTAWGREIASRLAVQLDAGLVGDAVELECGTGGRLVAWKPAFGGQVLAAITSSSPVQLVTVRAGVLPTLVPRPTDATGPPPVTTRAIEPRSRVRIRSRTRDDDLEVLAEAEVVIGVGQGVLPHEYARLEPLRAALGAELGATRKVTDQGWLPRARQIGITGRSIAPRLFVSIGASGKFNHTVGVRAAGTVLTVNPDPDAPIFDAADIGIVGDWHDALPLLVDALTAGRTTR